MDPEAGSTPPAGASPSGPTSPADVPSEERTLAMLCHLLAIFTWIIGPLIIWLMKKDQSVFVDDQGKEALNFQLTYLFAGIVVGVLTLVTCGIGAALAPVIWALNIVFCILATVDANAGKRYRYPVCIRLIS